jgi:hypothetical protein
LAIQRARSVDAVLGQRLSTRVDDWINFQAITN